MITLVILAPIAMALLLPLVMAAIVFRFWSRRTAVARGRQGRVRRAAACLFLGIFATVGLLSPLVLTGSWCRATPRGDVKRGDSFVVLAFGMGPSGSGKSNLSLAEWLLANNRQRKPVVVQAGIRLALLELSRRNRHCLDGWTIIGLPERDGVYLDTSVAAIQADTDLEERKLTKPILVAHDLQLQRMAWAMEGIGVRGAIVPSLPPTPFDHESVQHWGTRWKSLWLAREAFAARPLTLRPQYTMALVALAAVFYGISAYRVWRHYNPVPVVTVLFPTANGLLVVRRAVKPAVGMLAFPGGYVDEDEAWQAAAVRELKEETGIEVNQEDLELFLLSSTRRGHMVVIYALVKPREPGSILTPAPSAEVSELRVLMRPIRFTWGQDTEAARRYFEGRPLASPETPDTIKFPDSAP